MSVTCTFRIHNLMTIDDNSVDQLIYKRVAQRSGLVGRCIQCASGEDALSQLADAGTPRPDLLLLDVHMPVMDGFEFVEAATQRFGDRLPPVILMLGAPLSPANVKHVADLDVIAGMQDKPLTPQALSAFAERFGARG